MPVRTALAVALPFFISVANIAAAQDDAPVQLDKVTTEHHGVTSVMPYAVINRVISQLELYGEGLVRFEFKLAPADPKKPLVAPTLALQHPDFYRPLPVQADGSVQLPILPAEQAADADVVSNQAKGTMKVMGTIKLTVKPDELDMAKVRKIMSVAETLRSKMLPWYLRMLAPQMDGITICSARPEWELQWREKGQLWGVPLPVDPGTSDPDAAAGQPPRVCAVLTGKERWRDDARLVAPPDATLNVKLR